MIPRPSRRGTRPRALDVSFGCEDADESATPTSDASRKRDRSDAGDADIRGTKRRNLDSEPKSIRKYERRPYEMQETKHLFVFGEEPDPPNDGKKHIRVLSRFTFFDGKPDTFANMASLDVLDEGMDSDHCILGAGFVVTRYDVDEDEGQEDDPDQDAQRVYIRMTRILRYFTRYWEAGSPFYVETDHAIYELNVASPSKRYLASFRPFWRLQTILRTVISTALANPKQMWNDFMEDYRAIDVFGEPMTENELWDAVPKLEDVLETVPHGDDIRASVVVHYLLTRMRPVLCKPTRKEPKNQKPMYDETVSFEDPGNLNLDLAVLRSKTQTHVTPRIGRLARGLFRETIMILGSRPRAEPEVPQDELRLRLQQFLTRVQNRRLVQFRPDQRIGRSRQLKHILIDGERFEVGDTVLFYPKPGNGILPNPNDLPPTDTLADHFWFAKIIHMNEEHETVHVQWFDHGSKTLLQELGDAQELFLTDQCDTQPLKLIIGKVKTHYIRPDQSVANVQSHDYFYRYLWEDTDGTFTDIDLNAIAAAARERPGENCPACEVHRNFDEKLHPMKIHLGIRYLGDDFHLDDCVLLKADDGPCRIGHIVRFNHRDGLSKTQVVVRLFGRIDKIGCRPGTTLKDERHLFYTHDEMATAIDDLIEVCHVVIKDDMPDLETWLEMSPNRFYVKYRFPSLNVTSWDTRRRMRWDDLPVCPMCLKKDFKTFKGMQAFLQRQSPLRVFDPFSGVGAFSLAMEEVGCFKLTHGVEIAPSMAETLRENASPGVKVYNQCSNLVLKQAILAYENKNPPPLKSVTGESLPPPPKPGEIDCIMVGFPCQPHSTLNMFQRADDRKSSLILTVLSYVDHLKPSYCIFENVRGFLRYSLRSRQHGKHTVRGGIPVGGLKLVVAALLDMGYQVRSALLQAGHYGTPQTRIRFFLIAAKRGLELPAFPQPSHDFPSDALEIKFPEGPCLSPITAHTGIAPHRHVSVHDAISDLPKFDWAHPKEKLTRRQMEEKRVKECRLDQPWCGYQGPNVPYEHEPHTRFQKACRRRPTRDIQQYTKTCDPAKVERVLTIPVEPGADYRSLPPNLWQYQFANPTSAVARQGFKEGWYGRVPRDEWFQTTVTNVDPMAKQSRVIHPYSKRVVTVRELARSQGFPDHFVFRAQHNRVTTMHRQIGNAVPWQVSVAIAREFLKTLSKNWEKSNPVEEPRDVGTSGDSAEEDWMDVD